MTTQVLIAKKADKVEVLGIESGTDTLKSEFKAIVIENGRGYESIELLDSRSGRIKSKKFSPAVVVVTEKPTAKKNSK
jgi:hypothetical protein